MPDTQYFTNIDGKCVKDAEARQQLNDLEDYVESLDQPWQPLEDGYSNFWFELTDDTLSPWLNFSAKTESAVIDWGDGSGEVSLDTLTPTHTYAKAGRYVVKVKGVTGIAAQNPVPNPAYTAVLKNVELNSDVLSISNQGFYRCGALENVVMQNSVTSIGAYVFQYSVLIKSVVLSSNISAIGAYFMCYDYSIKKITIPASVISIGSSAFNTCAGMSEVHIQATTPPSLGSYAFSNLASNYIIYVPVGYGDTYKSAAGWSSYADHILEEGQTPNRAMLAKFNEKTDEPQDDMR